MILAQDLTHFLKTRLGRGVCFQAGALAGPGGRRLAPPRVSDLKGEQG